MEAESDDQVKEVIVAAIGGIGMPEAAPCIDTLVRLLTVSSDRKQQTQSNPQVKQMAVWALGRLACLRTIAASGKILKAALTDKFYKVRAAALGTLVSLG